MTTNFSNLSMDFLESRKGMLESRVKAHEAALMKTRSYLYGLWLTSAIRDDKEELHQIEAELAYREKHNNPLH